ncbi:hypothetical protein SU32_16720 [Ahrensia marina]|uniref:Uncharacterized protein n=1 Tax=Ahrensia marina TaxID=1514904 RepID=A0A0M9GKK0_9HYPH|nr:hypothetical protein SU32_16720 [Ahrensia marina]
MSRSFLKIYFIKFYKIKICLLTERKTFVAITLAPDKTFVTPAQAPDKTFVINFILKNKGDYIYG